MIFALLNGAAALLSLGLMAYSSKPAAATALALGAFCFALSKNRPDRFLPFFAFLLPTVGWLGVFFSIHAVPFLLPVFFAGAAAQTKAQRTHFPLAVKIFAGATVFSAVRAVLPYLKYFPDPHAVVAQPPWGPILLGNALGWICLALLISLSGVSFWALFWPVLKEPASTRRLLQSFFLGFLLSAAVGVIQYVSGDSLTAKKFLSKGIRQYNALFLNPNTLGTSAALLFPVWLGYALTFRRPATIWLVGPALVFLVAIASARSAFLLMSTSLIAWTVLAAYRRQKFVLIGIFLSFILGAIFLVHQQRVYADYGEHSRGYMAFRQIKSVAGGQRAARELLNDRWPLWNAGWVVFRHNPVFGLGTGNYLIQMPGYKKELSLVLNDNCGNLLLHIMAEQGLMGLFFFLLLYLSIMLRHVRTLFSGADAIETGAFMSLLGLLSTSVFAAHTLNFEVNIIAWLLLGILFFSPRRREQTRS